MSSTVGMMGINSDVLTLSNNLSVTNTITTQNLTVSGIINFPVSSIPSTCISGGGLIPTQIYNNLDSTTSTIYHIHFSPSLSIAGNNSVYQTGTIGASNSLTFNPGSGLLAGATISNATNASFFKMTGATTTNSNYNIALVNNNHSSCLKHGKHESKLNNYPYHVK